MVTNTPAAHEALGTYFGIPVLQGGGCPASQMSRTVGIGTDPRIGYSNPAT